MTSLTNAATESRRKVSYNPFSQGTYSVALPTTKAQREMWASLVLDPNATLCYNESLAITIHGDLNPKLMNLAFQELIKRHDALRMVFSGNGKYFYVKEYSPQDIQYLDWSQNDQSLEQFKKDQVGHKFNLQNGPLFLASLIKTSEKEHQFILTAHHIVCDGWSFAILLSELTTIYTALVKNISFSFEPACQFSDFAREEAASGLNQACKAYWINQFKDSVPVNKLPLDFPRPAFRTFESQRIEIEVAEDLAKRIKKFSALQGCSLYTTLMGTFQVLLHKITNEQQLVVGMASATQSESGKSDLVGHLVNLLPLRAEIHPDQSFRHFLKEVRTRMLDAFDHQHISFGSLVEKLKIERNPSEIPLVSTVFNIDQQSPGQGLKFDGPKASYTTTARSHENFELFVNVVSCENRLAIECQYNKNLFLESTVQNWFECYVNLLDEVIKNPEASIAVLRLEKLHVPSKTKVRLESQQLSSERYPETENALIAIWKEVLNLSSVSVEQNFFSIGGHSLLAVELAHRIQQGLKVEASIRDIFERPTVMELAQMLARQPKSGVQDETEIPSHGARAVYPVTHNQMQVWYLEELYKGTVMHNLPSSIRLKFAVNPALLRESLQYLVKRHPALRTTIALEESVPVQKILRLDQVLDQVHLEVISCEEKELITLLNQEAQHVFDKTQAPLFKAKLFELGPQDYVFFFMVHHAIWDGWSFDIFFEELNTIYSALVRKQEPTFERDPEISYGDFSLWLEASIQNGKLNNQLAYWQNKLSSPLPVLELPVDYKRPVTASHEGCTYPFQLSADQALHLREYAKKQGTSLFNVILAAFKITLARYANIDDVIVGSPVRNRVNPKLRQTIGYFVNTVALRTRINLGESFESNLKNVIQTCLEAFDHQTLPFQVVLNKVDHARDPGRTPIFQTFFSYQDVSNREGILNGHPYSQINIDKASTHTDLDLWIKANDKKVEGAFEYRKDLFRELSIQRFHECFMNLLDNLSKNADAPLLSDSLLPEKQKELVLNEWNKTFSDPSDLIPFHKRFEEVVREHPSQRAIFNANGSLTYKDLNARANRVAHGLISLGVKRGDLVGLSLTRDLNMMVAILGILKSGAGYVPLDPAFPQDRLDYMLESSTPKTLITEPALAKRFSHYPSLKLVESFFEDPSLSEENPAVDSGLTETMYVIYTSGSTGKPKGVQISHGALANFLESMRKAPGISSQDKLLAVTTLSFDIATLEIYLPLTVGASLYLASSYDVIDGKALRQIIENNEITVMQATPSSWRLLLGAGWKGSDQFKALCGGEPFPKDLAHKLLGMCREVWNMYGPTETTVWSTTKKLNLQDESVTIGRPIDNTFTYILDEGLNPAPIGAPGELYIGGLGLADGYFKRPDLTSERFVPNPFVKGERMYATGDFARYLPDGDIECLGRQDGQVKVRGYRIELGEIEAVLSKISSVQENAVITKETRPGDVRIIAFVIPKAGMEFDEKSLRDELGESLPKYMIPSHFVGIDELPKTLNGKIDKKTLGANFTLHQEEPPQVHESKAPESNLEMELKSIWSEVLGTPIQDGDNFFHKGGNSLLAVQLFSKISRLYKVNLPLSLLLESENFMLFAQAVKNKIQTPLNIQTVAAPGIFKSLVTIKPHGQFNPVFCFHGVGGNVLNYMSLVPALGDKRALIGLQSRGMDRLHELADSVEDMAAHYIREMKVIQPQGPYYLAGGSMGGMIAFEVAQQLTRQGDSIDKLVMFDTFGPKIDIQGYDKSERSFFKNLRISLFYRRKTFFNNLRVKILRFFGLEIPLDIKLFNVEMNNYRALWKYKPLPYEGDLHLIRGRIRTAGWYSDPKMGWAETIQGDVHTYEIDGNHGEFIESPELCQVFTRLL